MTHTKFLIIGAGPYSLATAAYANSLGVETVVVGKVLDFWKTNMPREMFLRSGPDWHLDARDTHTFEAFVKLRGYSREQITPVPLDVFLDYGSWFMGQYDVTTHNAHVTRLEKQNDVFHAQLDDGSEIQADQVLVAPGFTYFKNYPQDVVAKLPHGSYLHTCDTVDFEFYRGKRALIVGGRQSAFEWGALMREHGAQEIFITHPHDTPKFTQPDWAWVQPMARLALADHAWWRKLTSDGQEKIRRDFWAAGRLILESWLDERVHQPNIHIHGKTNIANVTTCGNKTYDVTLDDGTQCNVHHIILATGYKPNIQKVAFFDRATILDQMQTVDGFPALDTEFQTTVPNLYITGFAATRDFGPFFGFTVACPVAARIIGDAIAA